MELLRIILISLILCSCSKKEEFDENKEIEIKALLYEDRKNKELEFLYLEEIRIAQENDDLDAYEYFFQEYMNVPRLHIPEEYKTRPDYVKGGVSIEY